MVDVKTEEVGAKVMVEATLKVKLRDRVETDGGYEDRGSWSESDGRSDIESGVETGLRLMVYGKTEKSWSETAGRSDIELIVELTQKVDLRRDGDRWCMVRPRILERNCWYQKRH